MRRPTLGRMRRGLLLTALGAAIAIWLFATAALATGDWWLECAGDGGTFTGIDCLEQLPGSARTTVAPARWFGFTSLLVMWLGSAVTIPALSALAARQGRSTTLGPLERPEHPSAATRR